MCHCMTKLFTFTDRLESPLGQHQGMQVILSGMLVLVSGRDSVDSKGQAEKTQVSGSSLRLIFAVLL